MSLAAAGGLAVFPGLAADCGWTFLRSLSIALLGLTICCGLGNLLRSLPGLNRKIAWTAMLLPFFTPDLLIGYAYANFSLSLIRYPVWNEVLYGFLLLLKLVPVGTLAVCVWPPAPVSAEAIHCHRLALRPSDPLTHRLARRMSMAIRGPAGNLLPAAAVMFLLAFQEFEIASLMGTTSWTVWLFDVQARGLPTADTLMFALLPLACEMVVLVPVLVLAVKGRGLTAAAKGAGRRPSALAALCLACYLLAAVAVICVTPSAIVGRSTVEGFTALWTNPGQATGLGKEILCGLAWGLISGIGAYGVAAWLLSSRIGTLGTVVVSLPGLLGSLALSLMLLSLFQLQLLNPLYGKPVPLLAALVLFLLPRALILQLFLRAVQPRERLHLAVLLSGSAASGQGRQLVWHLRIRGHFWSMVLLAYWGYLDLTITSLLPPIGMESAPVRLYNQMHYGPCAVLSAMTCVAIVVPLLLFVALAVARRRLLRLLVP